MERYSRLDIRRLAYILQAKAPLLQLSFVGFLRAHDEAFREVLVGCVDQGLGEFVPVVHLLNLTHPFELTVLFLKGGVDDLGVLEHELLRDRATAWLGVGLLVYVLEDLRPNTALVAGVVDAGPVAEPRGDLLQRRRRSSMQCDVREWKGLACCNRFSTPRLRSRSSSLSLLTCDNDLIFSASPVGGSSSSARRQG